MPMIRQTLIILLVLQTITSCVASTCDDRPLRRPLRSSYDYIIVGGGTSGAVLASRLSEGSDSVLLVEAGRSDLENAFVPVPAFSSTIQLTPDDWNYFSVPQKRTGLGLNDRRGYWPRGKILGGCSSTGYHAHNRGSKFDYDEWSREGAKGWSYKNVLPYFLKSEDMQIPELSQSRFCPMQSNIKNGTRCSSVSCFLRRVLHRPNLQVSVKTHCSKVLIRRRRAIGVEVIKDDKRLRIFANKEVILSAGIINSPQILMLSGIGPASHLRKFGIPVMSNLPVGKNLQDQLSIILHYTIDDDITYTSEKLTDSANFQQWNASRTGILTRAGTDGTLFAKTAPSSQTPDNYPDVWILGFSYASDVGIIESGLKFNYKPNVIENQVKNADSSGFNLFPTLVRPESKGTVRISSNNPFVAPTITPNHLASAKDIKTMLRGIRLAQKLVATRSFQMVKPRFLRRDFGRICKQRFNSNAYWICMLRHFSVHIYHACCTNRMGARNDPSAVVDQKLRVRGIRNLRVVDASVMRNQIAGDPHAVAIMIAEKAADIIRCTDTVGKWRRQVSSLFQCH
ncbi:uncharacterized protein LOC134697523 [Mytilus trossulus]|uniref:uncharacterized protein LOC134697523 n=1 Tax=Mytilus trossulus TaxID=6551 RepID=UPI0030072D33